MPPHSLPPDSVEVWVALGFAAVVSAVLLDIASDGLVRRLIGFTWRRLAAAGRVRLSRSRRRLFGRREPADLAVVTGSSAAQQRLVRDRNEELWLKLLGGCTAALDASLALYRVEHADFRPEVVATVRGVPVFDIDFTYARRYAIDVRFLLAVRAMWHGHGPGPDWPEAVVTAAELPEPEPEPAATRRVIDL